jgi:MFS family permease
MLVMGSLGDLLGHRNVFAAGLMLFSVSSLLCGLAPDPLFLNVSRAVQGVGGAAMFATSLALIAREFRGPERGTALGIWGATAGVSVAIGPLIGGALTSGISWRWVFFVNVPIGVLTLWLLLGRVGETRRRRVRPDWLGAVAFSGALFALVFALIRGNPDGWSSTKVTAAFVAGACCWRCSSRSRLSCASRCSTSGCSAGRRCSAPRWPRSRCRPPRSRCCSTSPCICRTSSPTPRSRPD